MRVLARRDGLFGPIRVMERQADRTRLYCIKSSVQTMTLPDGVSAFGYVHAAKLLARAAPSVLLIGGGGGSLATMLARRGQCVTVIDVDPAAEELARAYFALDRRVEWLTRDPLPFLRDSARRFDAIIIDACDAEGVAPPFDDVGVLCDLIEQACPGGSLILNLVHKDDAPQQSGSLPHAFAARGYGATLYRSEEGWEGNEVLHVRKDGVTDTLSVTDLERHPAQTRTYLMSLRAFTQTPIR